MQWHLPGWINRGMIKKARQDLETNIRSSDKSEQKHTWVTGKYKSQGERDVIRSRNPTKDKRAFRRMLTSADQGKPVLQWHYSRVWRHSRVISSNQRSRNLQNLDFFSFPVPVEGFSLASQPKTHKIYSSQFALEKKNSARLWASIWLLARQVWTWVVKTRNIAYWTRFATMFRNKSHVFR